MLLELVEGLCNVASELLEIIDSQAIVIEQSKIEEEVKREFRDMREDARTEVNRLTKKYGERE